MGLVVVGVVVVGVDDIFNTDLGANLGGALFLLGSLGSFMHEA